MTDIQVMAPTDTHRNPRQKQSFSVATLFSYTLSTILNLRNLGKHLALVKSCCGNVGSKAAEKITQLTTAWKDILFHHRTDKNTHLQFPLVHTSSKKGRKCTGKQDMLTAFISYPTVCVLGCSVAN